MIGLLAIALALPIAVSKYTSASRLVTVKGLCEKEVDADRAIWPIVFKESGNSLVDLASSVESKNSEIVKWLNDNGFSSEEITIAAPKVEDTRTMGYDSRKFDFVMTSVITVCSGKVAKVVESQKRQFDLLSRGIAVGGGNSWEYPVSYDFAALNQIKPEMIQQATLNAREAAGKFAKDSGSKVGKIISANQGQFSITDRDANTPYKKIVRVVTTITYSLK